MTPIIKAMPFNELIEAIDSECNKERLFAVPPHLTAINKAVHTFDEAIEIMEIEAITYYEKHGEPLMMELYDAGGNSAYRVEYVCDERTDAHNQFAKERWGD